VVSNAQGFVTAQHYDTNLLADTTNWFQCFDIPLTNGLNRVTLHAVDLAGNVTTVATNYTLDYSGATNAPVFQLFWRRMGSR